jgi:pimeloyl-ACP methyl ester carboxylesterase
MHLAARPRFARRTAIVALGAAIAVAMAACSVDGASTATTTGPATSLRPAATATAPSKVTELAADSSIADPVDNGGGRTISVHGRELFVECRGTGSPTVILQSGFGDAGDKWSLSDTTSPAVFPALAETNRVCIYDRPGSMITTTDTGGTVTLADAARPGRSGSAPMPRDPADVVTELHDLLAAADVPGPYVLVGHSLGGAFDLLYARTYPDDVAGLVFVDSPMPTERGLIRPDLWEAVKVMSLDASLVPGYQLESYDVGTLFDEIEAADPLPGIPVVVIRRGGANMTDDDTVPEGAPFTQAEIDAINNTQWAAQAQWASGVPDAEVITVPDTTHYVQSQRPDVVIEAIRGAIARG